MVVRLLMISILTVGLASCRADKRSFKNLNLSNGDGLSEMWEPPSTEEITQGSKDKDAAVAIENQKRELILSAVKQLKLMLDVSLYSPTPMRVSGQVIMNSTADIELRKIVSDQLLFETLNQGQAENHAYSKIKELVEKKASVSFDLRARLVPTGSFSETIKAVELLRRKPEMGSTKNNTALIPISVELSSNFFKPEPLVYKKNFYAILFTDQDGWFQHFNLVDVSNLKEAGKLTLFLTESNHVKDQKMIVEFLEEKAFDVSKNKKLKLEYVIPLQMNVVNFIKN